MKSLNMPETGEMSRTSPAGRVKGVCMFTMGAAVVAAFAAIAMAVIAAPDGPVMKTAVKGIVDHQQAIAVAYLPR